MKAHTVSAMDIDSRIDAYAWTSISEHLDVHGWAMIMKLLTPSECEAVAGLYANDRHFRSHIVMAREPATWREPTAFRSSPHRRRDLPRREMSARLFTTRTAGRG